MNTIRITGTARKAQYEELLPQLLSLVQGEFDVIAVLASVTAALKSAFLDFSWIGFYLLKGNELVVGPFQGKVACLRIRKGEGVCGASVERKQTIIVPDVSKFPGHIYCDPDSKSEIVVPLLKKDDVFGVLDIDSAFLECFSETDKKYLEQIAEIIIEKF
jgi:L-methionine (R)-S-oxide reductase